MTDHSVPTTVCGASEELPHVLKLIRRCFSAIRSLDEKIRECLEVMNVDGLGEKVDARESAVGELHELGRRLTTLARQTDSSILRKSEVEVVIEEIRQLAELSCLRGEENVASINERVNSILARLKELRGGTLVVNGYGQILGGGCGATFIG